MEDIIINVTKALLAEIQKIPKNGAVNVRVVAGIGKVFAEEGGEEMQLQLSIVRDKKLFTVEGEINRENSTVFLQSSEN